MPTNEPSFICPVCHMQSFNPSDIMYNYCGNCHQFIPEWKVEKHKDLLDFLRST